MSVNQTQYREVKRKAAVGERIKIVEARGGYPTGSTWLVEDADHLWAGIKRDGTGVSIDGGKPLYHHRYVVLEPVASALTSDPLYAAFRQFVADNAAEIRAILPELEPRGVSVFTSGGTLRVNPDGGLTYAAPKLTRAQVIAKATADVAELTRAVGNGQGHYFGVGGGNETRFLNVEFNVNREKRAVNVLVRGQYTKRVWAKFTAKCSPADVFHAEIGKAIALRKALGLTVPTEYTDAPQPDKPLVGARVSDAMGTGVVTGFDGHRGINVNDGPGKGGFWTYTDGVCGATTLDDTDVDYSAVLAEGAAA